MCSIQINFFCLLQVIDQDCVESAEEARICVIDHLKSSKQGMNSHMSCSSPMLLQDMKSNTASSC